MKLKRLPMLLLAAGAVALQAQDVKVNALVELWSTQMLNTNLRLDKTLDKLNPPSTAYYEGLSTGRFQENGFYLKRSEITLNYKVSDELSANIMFDPNLSTSSVGNNVLQDAIITWTPGYGMTVRAGQFKMPTTYEATIIAARDILFFDRNQLNRVFGDKRDRGIAACYAYGEATGFQGKVHLAFSNGNAEDGSGGKSNEVNAQKDYIVRFEGGYGTVHKFGFYYRRGDTNLKESSLVAGQGTNGTPVNPTLPAAWTNAGVTAHDVMNNRDKTTLNGIYYAYDTSVWHFDAEGATGLLGRRFPTLFASAGSWAPSATTGVSTFTPNVMAREHLDQKYLGYALTAVYKMGHHQFLARYDYLNYNQGDKWYTATNPYTTNTTTGVATGNDYTPKYTETTVGYNYLFVPAKSSYGKLKVDYIMRSKNFLAPRAGQIGAQGGDSLVASLMIAF
jgi:hypothetical protein